MRFFGIFLRLNLEGYRLNYNLFTFQFMTFCSGFFMFLSMISASLNRFEIIFETHLIPILTVSI